MRADRDMVSKHGEPGTREGVYKQEKEQHWLHTPNSCYSAPGMCALHIALVICGSYYCIWASATIAAAREKTVPATTDYY